MDTHLQTIDSSTQREVIHNLSAKLRACYIFPGAAEQICTCLHQHLQDGDYAGIPEGDFFALALTMHLQEVSHDEHLWVKWHADPLPEGDSPLRLNPAWQEERRLEAILANHGFQRVERLAGNVGCLDLRYFHRPEWGAQTSAAAFNFLANTQSLIIDLRQCTGGFPGMVALVCSYLFEEEPLHLSTIAWHDDGTLQEFWTTPHLPGRRYAGKPVYALISRTTFSGGEQFADILQSRQRAVLVGEKTGGGAHAGASYRLHPHFEAFIPIGQVTNPVNGADWEGRGVTPDIATLPAQAFNTAYRLALQGVLAECRDSPAGPLQAVAAEAQTTLKRLATAWQPKETPADGNEPFR